MQGGARCCRGDAQPHDDRRRPRLDPDAGLGVELLPAGDPRRADRRRARPAAERVLRHLFAVAAAVGRARSDGRADDRPARRARGARRLEPGARRRPRPAGAGPGHRRAGGRLAVPVAGDRDGAVRFGLCRADRDLRPPGARADHRHHPDRRLCQHHRLARLGLVRAQLRLARGLPDLGGDQPVRRAAAQLVRHPARALRTAAGEAPRGAMPILAFFFSAAWFVTGAMAAHLPRLLQAAGADETAAIAAAALVGPAQVAARLVEFGLLRAFHPVVSARVAAILHPLGAAVLLALGPAGAVAFALLHGAGNGMITIAKGTLPLAIFGPVGYGQRSGVLSAPARVLQSAAPFLFGVLLDGCGSEAVLLSAGLSLAACASLFALRTRQRAPAPLPS